MIHLRPVLKFRFQLFNAIEILLTRSWCSNGVGAVARRKQSNSNINLFLYSSSLISSFKKTPFPSQTSKCSICTKKRTKTWCWTRHDYLVISCPCRVFFCHDPSSLSGPTTQQHPWAEEGFG